MLNITDGPLWWSCIGLPLFIGFYLCLTLKTADKKQQLCFHFFDRKNSNIPWPKHTRIHFCPHRQLEHPALLLFLIIPLCSKSSIIISKPLAWHSNMVIYSTVTFHWRTGNNLQRKTVTKLKMPEGEEQTQRLKRKPGTTRGYWKHD